MLQEVLYTPFVAKADAVCPVLTVRRQYSALLIIIIILSALAATTSELMYCYTCAFCLVTFGFVYLGVNSIVDAIFGALVDDYRFLLI